MTSPANDERRRKSLESIERRLEELPNLSSVVTRLALMDPNSTGFTAQVEMLVREDPPLATRLLRYASKNGYPVRTIPQAIARVGARPLAELITSMSVQRVFVPSNLGQRNLWLHAIQVAVAARIYAQNRPELQTDPEEAYFAGLLHDVGRFVMFDRSPAELGQVDEIGWTTPDELIEAELRICGLDHAELGWHACKAWDLPEKVSTLIRDHHVYESSKPGSWPPEMLRLVRLVQAADISSIALLSDPGFRRQSAADQAARMKPHWKNFDHMIPIATAEQLEQIDVESHGLALGLDLIIPW